MTRRNNHACVAPNFQIKQLHVAPTSNLKNQILTNITLIYSLMTTYIYYNNFPLFFSPQIEKKKNNNSYKDGSFITLSILDVLCKNK